MDEKDLVAEHFEDLEKQAHASRLGIWVFLASEVLLFAGIFTLYAAYRSEMTADFEKSIEHNTRILGSINTGVLLVSSYLVASAVTVLRRAKRLFAVGLTAGTVVCGVIFLVIKFTEYAKHFGEGIYPGHTPFWTLYFVATGLHALHVIVGMTVLTFLGVGVFRGKIHALRQHPLEIGAVYWHLVDVIWIFIWPLFYLTPGSAS
jgi:cytochrome c oxidase subunit 3